MNAKELLKAMLMAALLLTMLVFWASQCSAQSTFTRDAINTTRLTVLGSEKLFFSTDSSTPAAGYIKLWARDSLTLYLIRSSGVKVNLLSTVIDTSVLATQYDISLKSAAFGTVDTSGLAVNKILKWSGSAWTVRDDTVGSGGASDSTSWIATDYEVSLKLAKSDTASLSSRINLKLTASDTASLSNRINLRLLSADTASLSDRINTKLAAVDTASLSVRINTKLTAADTTSLSNRINGRLLPADTASLSNRIDLKLSALDTASLSVRINTKLTATDTASLSARIDAVESASDTTSLSNRINLKLTATDTASLSNRINLKLTGTDTASLSNRINLKLTATDTASLSSRIDAKLTASDTASLSSRINARADSATVLYWADTTVGIATADDLLNLQGQGVAYLRSAADTIDVTVSSMTSSGYAVAWWTDSTHSYLGTLTVTPRTGKITIASNWDEVIDSLKIAYQVIRK
jgi:hypothetical protein